MSESAISRLTWWGLTFIVAALTWQAARLTWEVWEGAPEVLTISASASGKKESAAVQSNYLSWHLFGKAEENAAAKESLKQVEAPVTTLRLDLYGVVVGTDEGQSGAIIAERGRGAEYYRLGDVLPGNAKLAAVYSDHILLSRAGVLEKLAFDEGVAISGTDIEQVAQPSRAPARVDSPEDFMAVAQQQLEQDPKAALAAVGLAPATESGNPAGYVYSGNNPMLSAMNMEKGDVIRSVNGHQLGNLEQDKQMLQELYDSGVLEVEIEREGATFTISYPLR